MVGESKMAHVSKKKLHLLLTYSHPCRPASLIYGILKLLNKTCSKNIISLSVEDEPLALEISLWIQALKLLIERDEKPIHFHVLASFLSSYTMGGIAAMSAPRTDCQN